MANANRLFWLTHAPERAVGFVRKSKTQFVPEASHKNGYRHFLPTHPPEVNRKNVVNCGNVTSENEK